MKLHEATGLIRVKIMPAGEAPTRIRKMWIGPTFPCFPILGFPEFEDEREVLTGRLVRPRMGVDVPQDLAIEVLRAEAPEAAAYWMSLGLPQPRKCFCFGEHEIEIISGVEYQRLIHWNEMDGGPYR